MSIERDIRIDSEFDPLFDFHKHYNPTSEDIEKAEILMCEYEKRKSQIKSNNK